MKVYAKQKKCSLFCVDRNVYNAVKSTFFSSRTVHVIVWDMRTGDQGFGSIQDWIQEIPVLKKRKSFFFSFLD